MIDVYTLSSSSASVLAFTSTSGEAVSASIAGDMNASVTSTVNAILANNIISTGSVTAIEVDDASAFPSQGYVLIAFL